MTRGTNPVPEALEQAGINVSTLDRIRLARGVVGKTSYVAGAAILALAMVAWGLRDLNYLIADAVLVVILFVVYVVGALWFANRHPGVALLEGAELIQWRQLELGAKSMPAIADLPEEHGDEPQ
jgi:hypothetical protein